MRLRNRAASLLPGLLAAATGLARFTRCSGAACLRCARWSRRPDAAHDRNTTPEHLWSLLAAMPWRGRHVAVVRGEEGRDWLASQWQEAGADVRFVPPRDA